MKPEQSEKDFEFWTGLLAGASLHTPLDHVHDGIRGDIRQTPIDFPVHIIRKLDPVYRDGTALCVSFWGLLLLRCTSEETVMFSWNVPGSDPNESLPVLLAPEFDSTFADLLALADKALQSSEKHKGCLWKDLAAHYETYAGETTTIHAGILFLNKDGNSVGLPETIDIALMCSSGAFSILWREGLFEEWFVNQMAEQLTVIADKGLDEPSRGIHSFGLLSPSKAQTVLYDWNSSWSPFPSEKTIQEQYEEMAGRYPDSPAVLYSDHILTYDQLNQQANKLAYIIRQYMVKLTGRSMKPDVIIGLCVGRNLDMVVGTLGILKAGGAYMPLDPNYPEERLKYMIEDSDAPIIVTETDLLDRAPFLRQSARGVICLDRLESLGPAEAVENLEPINDSSSLAYVIYTSGSTGNPKGVLVEHHSVVHLARNQNYVEVTPSDCLAMGASISFDAATFELWGALLNGARTVLLDKETLLSFDKLAECHRRYGVTIQFLTTALFNLIADVGPGPIAGVRATLFGGEEANAQQVRRVMGMRREDQEIIQAYGPTECTTFATTCRLDDSLCQDRSIPIGRGLERVSLYVLDANHNPVPPGVPGELYIGGEGVARGYLNRPDITAERFIANPFATPEQNKQGINQRLYKTGDRVKLRPDGLVEFMGRVDFQVKIRGFRIELEEIESVLASAPGVSQSAVTVQGESGDKRLVAYYVPRKGVGSTASSIRANLKSILPVYMVPSLLLPVDEMPLSPNGKINRKALTSPSFSQPSCIAGRTGDTPAAPLPDRHDGLPDLVAGVLGLSTINPDDDLICLGLHSLGAAKIATEIRVRFGISISIKDIFEHPSLAKLSQYLKDMEREPGSVEHPITRQPDHRHIPLTWQQEQIWFLSKLSTDLRAYNSQWTVRFEGLLDLQVLQRAIGEIIQRHEILRTTFHDSARGPFQTVHPVWTPEVPLIDLSHLSRPDREKRVDELIQEKLNVVFNCEALPLVNWFLFKLGSEEHVLLQVEHHFVHDGWEIGLFLKEMKEIYTAFMNREPCPLPELPVQYADYAIWQRTYLSGDRLREKVGYWKNRLAYFPKILNIPCDRPRSELQSFHGDAIRLDIDRSLYHELQSFGREHGVTLFVTMFSAFSALMAAWCNQRRLILGSGFANRLHKETEVMLGMFVNTVLMTADLTEDLPFKSYIHSNRLNILEDSHHYDTPFARIATKLRKDLDISRNPLFQVMFAFHDSAVPIMDFCGLKGSIVERHNATAKLDMNVICIPRAQQHQTFKEADVVNDDLTIVWEFNTDIFERFTIQRMVNTYLALLKTLIEKPSAPTLATASTALNEYFKTKPTVISREAASPPEAVSYRIDSLTQEAGPAKAIAGGSTVETLSRIWRKILKTSNVGIYDSFFELGGDSIKAVRMLTMIKQKLGVDVPVAQLFNSPVISSLAALIDADTSTGPEGDNLRLAIQDASLPIPSRNAGREAWHPRDILLTGATGFLGAFLVESLLSSSNARIHCMVRSVDVAEAKDRLAANLKRYGLDRLAVNPRVNVVSGDLSRDGLGLNPEIHDFLADSIDCIIHCGAHVHHMLDYQTLRKENVEGTIELLRLACSGRVKLFNYISTMSTALDITPEGELGEVALGDLPPSSNGYVLSKWVCEKYLQQAGHEGHPMNIFRAGNITGDSRTGICQPERNHALLLLKGCIQLKAVPDWTKFVDMSPVNILADAIASLALETEGYAVFNMNNPFYIPWRDYVAEVNRWGFNLELVPTERWQAMVQEIGENNALYPLKGFYIGKRKDIIARSTVSFTHYNSSETQTILKKRNLSYEIDLLSHIAKVIEYLVQIGFLPKT